MQDIKNAISHLREHQKYPATGDELIKECMNLSDFSEEDKKWFMENLPKDKTYDSADEVISALGWQKKPGMPEGEESWMQT